MTTQTIEILRRKLDHFRNDPIGTLRTRVGFSFKQARRLYHDKLYEPIKFSWPTYDICRWFLNRTPKKLYQIEKPNMELSVFQQWIIDQLEEKGIAVVHFTDLFSHQQLEELQQSAERLVQKPANQMRLEEIGRRAPAAPSKKFFTGADKFYIVPLLGAKPVFDLNDKFMEFSLSEPVLRIVCGYLEMFSRLVLMDLWYNVSTNGPDVFSQRWHRDPDDRKEVKLFLYLRDVNVGNGPFCYIPGSHNAGRFKRVFPQTIRISNYPPDGAVENKFSENQRQVCTGKAGTLIFCDTTGFHKGGHPTTDGRLLFTAVYTTNSGTSLMTGARLYSISGLRSDFVSPAAEYAISHLRD
jgi:hypothetical protein